MSPSKVVLVNDLRIPKAATSVGDHIPALLSFSQLRQSQRRSQLHEKVRQQGLWLPVLNTLFGATQFV